LLSPSSVHSHSSSSSSSYSSSIPESHTEWVAITEQLSTAHVRGAIMAISQMQLMPDHDPYDDDDNNNDSSDSSRLNITIMVTLFTGCIIGILASIICNRKWSSKLFPCFGFVEEEGIPLDTLQIGHTNLTDAYQRAMKTRYVEQPHLLTIIDPQEIFLQRIIGEGTFGRVWSARWNSASVAVKEFVFAQAAVIGRSSMQQEIIEEIIGEAGMMAILRHPNVLQLFGCSLTAQAIWIVSELCSLGSLRQILDDRDRPLPDDIRVNLALQVAEGMTYLHNQDPSIIHRDLKSHNIFVHETFIDTEQPDDSNINGPSGDGHTNQLTRWLRPQKMKTHSTLVAKIGDWGSARATLSGSRTMTHGIGTACWLAPEVIKHARSSKYSDVYGYGIILWEMGTRKEVYEGLESTQIIAMVANEGLRPPVPEDCPWKDVMVKCWAENPQDRLGFNEIVVELNRISKKLDEMRIENEIAIALLEEQERERQQEEEGTNAEEGTPLIEENITSSIRSKSRIFSNILRQRKGE
jgi:serine/threonine protein kinase